MAGTLTISTLSDGTNSTSSTNCIQGSAKAWVSWTGSSGTIRGSFNVSSITRASTGVYTVNHTTAMPDANYSAVATTSNNAGTGSLFATFQYTTYSTTQTNVVCQLSTTAGQQDPVIVNFAVFR